MVAQCRIMLIDDSDTDNYIHTLLIRRAEIVDDILVFQHADQALEYLHAEQDAPIDLILLDVNMPKMNGFEFLEAYADVPAQHRARALLLMVSTPLPPQEDAAAANNPFVTACIDKPLDPEQIVTLINTHRGT